jgi:hypothetical protein
MVKKETNKGKLYKNKTNLSPIIKYLYQCFPELKDRLLTEQVTMATDLANMKILNHLVDCGRGFGKTLLCAVLGMYFADVYSTMIGKPINVLIVSSQEALSNYINQILRNRPDLVARMKERGVKDFLPQKGLEFSDNGSRLIPRMATVHSVESYRADVIIFDESQDIDLTVVLKGFGCSRTDRVGKIILIGTPYTLKKGKLDRRNWFIELVKDKKHKLGDMKFHISRYPSDICWWNNVDVWKKSYGQERWDAEICGIVTAEDKRSYFGEAIDNCCYDILPFPQGGVRSRIEAGIDCGQECTAFVLTEKIGSEKRQVLYIDRWYNMSIVDLAPIIAKLINDFSPYITKIDSKQGRFQPDYLKEIKKYTQKPLTKIDASLKVAEIDENRKSKVSRVKQHMLGQFKRRVDNNHFILPMQLKYSDEVREQLLKYRVGMFRGDDLVDALLLSCYEPIDGFKDTGHSVGGFKDTHKKVTRNEAHYQKWRKEHGYK